MTWRNLFEGLGDFFEWTFQILPILGNTMNYLFMAIGTVMFIYWLGQMRKHARAGER
ncbi:MAG: hypothetical protein LPK80_06630 [Bacteroidota bacterium]|nr:hypothetical protein [Bacteroidota bacterium]MDX5404815.1 hypothetical protein [Bacteroidota bacterium]MDX5429379.1 hypothetical protein [Bacteroidota bacterium]MDX5447617.1 hypothetical protein [Bacteroidota bacterium]MDX5506979.1 hypothetical protein [Bacteroidota bacterium]